MKKSYKGISSGLLLWILTITSGLISCKKTENPIKFPQGTFPDTTIALTDINSVYDDYNTDVHELYGNLILIFSSNRISTGEQFDLVQGIISIVFDQTDGTYGLGCEMTTDAFLTTLLNAANTAGDDFGPYRLFSTSDGYEYLLLASENEGDSLDLYFLKNLPAKGSAVPSVMGPYPVNLLNTSRNDAYLCFDTNQDTAYFSSNSGGNFDIYLKKKPSETSLDTWLSGIYSASVKVDSVNTAGKDLCPFVLKKTMVFASDRPGGIGGFDIYYSVFKNGKWSSPVNFGPSVNTSSNEFRPVITTLDDFTNHLLIFSSDRSGGKGGFDLYSAGVTIK